VRSYRGTLRLGLLCSGFCAQERAETEEPEGIAASAALTRKTKVGGTPTRKQEDENQP
jgi:hypothetical protein